MASCQDLQPRLSLLLDGLLTAEDRAEVTAHLDGCPSCRQLVQDLERLRATARDLGSVQPPDHLWLEIAGQLRLIEERSPVRVGPTPSRGQSMWQWVGLAAALVVITLGAYIVVRWRTPAATTATGPNGAGSPAVAASVEGIEQELKLAEEHYDKAIAQLEAIVTNKDAPIDPVVASVLQKNLPVMDRAIADSRAALSGNPGNEAARDSLFEALRRKVSVLQDTVALMNEMRKGDQAAAAKVAAGMNKKS